MWTSWFLPAPYTPDKQFTNCQEAVHDFPRAQPLFIRISQHQIIFSMRMLLISSASSSSSNMPFKETSPYKWDKNGFHPLLPHFHRETGRPVKPSCLPSDVARIWLFLSRFSPLWQELRLLFALRNQSPASLFHFYRKRAEAPFWLRNPQSGIRTTLLLYWQAGCFPK